MTRRCPRLAPHGAAVPGSPSKRQKTDAKRRRFFGCAAAVQMARSAPAANLRRRETVWTGGRRERLGFVLLFPQPLQQPRQQLVRTLQYGL